MTICKTCTDKYYYQLVDIFSGNEEKAIERICSIFDWFYDENAVAATRRISLDRSRIGMYPSKLNLAQSSSRGSTFIDYIKLKETQAIDSLEKLEELRQGDSTSVSDKSVRKWGLGFTPEEYEVLNSQYKTLKDQSTSDDIVTENLIRDLCAIKVQQSRAIVNNDVDKYSKLTELYQKTLGSANLKPKSAKDTKLSDPDECWGVYIRDIEKYSPAEYYKDKKINADFDGISSYIERFLLRPMRNLFGKTNEMDKEYSISNGDD